MGKLARLSVATILFCKCFYPQQKPTIQYTYVLISLCHYWHDKIAQLFHPLNQNLLPIPISYAHRQGKYCIAQIKFWRGKTLANLAKMNVIHQYFMQPNSRFTKVANVSYCKFTNIFLAKTLKRSFAKVLPRQNFALVLEFCLFVHSMLLVVMCV